MPLPPARVDHVVLVGHGAATWRGLQVASLHGRRKNRLSLNSLSGRCESVLTAEAVAAAAPRRQRFGFPTMLAADFAPVPALAVGVETNVGREKASAAPSATRLKLSLGIIPSGQETRSTHDERSK